MQKATNRIAKRKMKKMFKKLIMSIIVCLICIVCAFFVKDIPVTENDAMPEKGNLNIEVSTGTQSDGLYEVSVTKVVDGDTLRCMYNGEEIKVRLNLIDTPESVSPNQEDNNEYGEMASNYTKSLLQVGDTIYLQFDKQTTDMYGRTLAYIWLSNQVDVSNPDDIKEYMINYILIEDGYARVALYNNDLYYDLFMEAEKEAYARQIGLWQYEEYRSMVSE